MCASNFDGWLVFTSRIDIVALLIYCHVKRWNLNMMERRRAPRPAHSSQCLCHSVCEVMASSSSSLPICHLVLPKENRHTTSPTCPAATCCSSALQNRTRQQDFDRTRRCNYESTQSINCEFELCLHSHIGVASDSELESVPVLWLATSLLEIRLTENQ